MNYSQTTNKNFSIEKTLAPKNLDKDLADLEHARSFYRTYSGREALLKQLDVLRCELENTDQLVNQITQNGDPSLNDHFATELKSTYQDALSACNDLIDSLLEIDNQNVGGELQAKELAKTPAKGDHLKAEARAKSLNVVSKENPGFWDKVKNLFTDTIDDWRGYTPEAKRFNEADENLYRRMTAKAAEVEEKKRANMGQTIKAATDVVASADEVATKSFSNPHGVRSMKYNTKKQNFSNAEACDMLAHKLTNDWFICEPQCQPLISEQLKAANVDCSSFAPALKCNVLQYDGEAPVTKSELAALDKVQMFIEALKKEIAAGKDCGGIEMIPAAKAFSLKRNLKRQLRCFSEAGDIDMEDLGTPAELIEAEEAGIELDNPEKYEAVAEAAEAGKLPAEMMAEAAEPAVMAPATMNLEDMGHAYDHVLDSTIADDPVGIGQRDMETYDPKPEELSLSAAPVGDAMAQMNEEAIVIGEDAGMTPAPIMADEAAAQNFSRSLHRKQAASKNFSAKKPVATRGLRNLLGDKYLK